MLVLPARFRSKKKMQTLNLARNVSDLTGRAEELEREATELRRENVWLKEIVTLKGSGLAKAPESAEAGDEGEDEEDGNASNPNHGGGKGKQKSRGKPKSED